MISFFDSAGDVLTAFGIWLVGAAFILEVGSRLSISIARSSWLYLAHSLGCILFTLMTKKNGADAVTYHLRALTGEIGTDFGTDMVSLIGFLPVRSLDLSYFGTNLFFSIFSCIGLLLLDSVIRDVVKNKSKLVRLSGGIFVFLPSVHFWTSQIGKDSLMLLGTGLVIWASQAPKTRLAGMCIGVGLMLLVRPHMALTFLLALVLGYVFSGNMPVLQKTLFLALGSLSFWTVLPIVSNMLGVDLTNPESAILYLEGRQSLQVEGGSSIDLRSISPAMRVYTFMFRPSLLEARSPLEAIVALENTVVLTMTLLIFINSYKVIFRWRSSSNTSIVRLKGHGALLIYGLLSWLLLSQVTYNLGLALRQKWMVLPFLFVSLLYFAKTQSKCSDIGDS